MTRRTSRAAAALLLAGGLASCGPASDNSVRERAYRVNNRGVALLEQLKYPEAATAFREALGIDPSVSMARLNLALALFYAQDLDAAQHEAEAAAQALPAALEPPYLLGLIARAQNRPDAARAFFDRVHQADAGDVGASVNAAQIALEERRYDEAIALLRPIVAAEPYHITASYVLGLALTRSGDAADGQRYLDRAQGLRQTGYAVTFGTGYLEQGRYAEAIASTGAEADLIDREVSTARFVREALGSGAAASSSLTPFGATFSREDLSESGQRALAARLGGGMTLLDVDSDGDLDLLTMSSNGQRLLRNDGGTWADIIAGSGLEAPPPGSVALGAVSADYDNDGRPDVFVMRFGDSTLYRNEGNGRFTDVTRTAELPAYPYLPGAAAFTDVDHDGDVDLVIAGLVDLDATRKNTTTSALVFPRDFAPAPLLLYRNNGNGTFTDVTREAHLDRSGHVIAIVPTDFDNHRDTDLLVVNRDSPPVLFANQRDGTFRDVAGEMGLAAALPGTDEITAVTAGDVNKDDSPDFLFARASGGVLALSDGRGGFTAKPGPEVTAVASQFLDYDNDGLLDVIMWTSYEPEIFRNLGHSAASGIEWQQVSAQVLPTEQSQANRLSSSRALGAADVDRNGTTDFVIGDGSAVWLWQNGGDSRRKSLRIDLDGRVSNRSGIGSKVQVRAGSLSSRLEVSAATPAVAPADLVFGLGARGGADMARVLWPSGILQAEVPPESSPDAVLSSPFRVVELDRKPSSCPFLFTWNGDRFEFVTDFLGGGEMGDWIAPRTFNRPDPVEYVRIRGEQLRPREGRLELRITNELEETLFLDQVELRAIAHPRSIDIYPNEGMTDPPKPFRLHAVTAARTPVRVTDDDGHDVTVQVARVDRQAPDDFALERIRGYARRHDLLIDIGSAAAPVLLLTGSTDYAFSSDNVAAHQAGLRSDPPALAVREADGRWRGLDVAVGIPVGRPQTIAVDLSGWLKPGEHELRLTTSMRIYWDRIEVGEAGPPAQFRMSTLVPRAAILRSRGFSAEASLDGSGPPGYDYAHVGVESPWKAVRGSYTREGDVRVLLDAADDRFVIAKSGDEIALQFDATALTAIPDDWTWTYLLRADGFSKEMDINSASPHTVEPLPFHAMSQYPYPSSERYPDSPEHRQYRETYNTRRVSRPLPLLAGSEQP